MKRFLFFLLLPLFAQTGFAQSASVEHSPRLVLETSSQPWATLAFNWDFGFPLQGETPLTYGNNVTVSPGLLLSPSSLNLTVDATWTPVSFAELSAGGRIGSGWNPGSVYGIGLNRASDTDGAAFHDGDAFDGALWEIGAGLTLLLEPHMLGLELPHGLDRLFLQSFHGISHAGYSRAGSDEAWFYANDDGENRNGVSYRGNLLIGYRQLAFLNMVGLMAQGDLFLNGPSHWHRSCMGDDLVRWTFSLLANFNAHERIDITLGLDLETRRQFRLSDEPGWDDLHFSHRTLSTRAPRIGFGRVYAIVTYQF